MREVRILLTAQIRLFPPDIIPVRRLALDESREAIRSLFKFQGVEPITRQESIVGLNFNAGMYGPNAIVIPNVAIEERRIVVRVEGESNVASSVYGEVRKKLEEFNNGRSIEEILCTHETVTSVVLDFPFERLFSDSLLSFLRKSAINHTKNKWSENLIVPSNLKFTVRYKVTDDTLINNHFTLAPKELVIEPREKSSPDERLYWIASPTDTDTHFKLIADLEKALAEK